MNSALVEFEDGQREIISRNALRRLAPITHAALDLSDRLLAVLEKDSE